ncbi:hypothetical protein CHARACLAT_010770 [Characodon lateralis]|uniref:Uncharacterized protein n=1 Tax=Characodon lateralis TaxID=208331 RepID=A0ABU7E2S7_9TELE|nr:hypothetical protein [Characodon lateralis]
MASRTKFYTVAEALDLITMDCGTEVCAEDFSSEDEELIIPTRAGLCSSAARKVVMTIVNMVTMERAQPEPFTV